LPSDLAAFSAGMLVNIEGTVVHHGRENFIAFVCLKNNFSSAAFNPSPPDAGSKKNIVC
jgi:hypothetical protein